jgi:hypothetical protein
VDCAYPFISRPRGVRVRVVLFLPFVPALCPLFIALAPVFSIVLIVYWYVRIHKNVFERVIYCIPKCNYSNLLL